MTKILLAFACAACVTIASCKTSSGPASTVDLSATIFPLVNFNFDSGGTHGLKGWTFHKVFDTVDFEMDTPPGGGTWSFKLHSVDDIPPTNYITSSFTGLKSGIYKYTVWSHSKYVYPDTIFSPAWISITKESGGILTTATHYLIDSLEWHPESLLDTLTLLPTDSVTIEISSGIAITHGNPTTVDNITFDTLP